MLVEDINNRRAVHCVQPLFTTIALLVWITNSCIHDFLQQCMQDLMDGFFPSELQARYPDGVPFEVQASIIQLLHFKFIYK